MSNNLGEIYGTIKDGRSCITIDSSSVDVTGNLNTTGINLFMSNEYLVTADPNGILNRFNRTVHMPSDFKDTDGNDITPDTEYVLKTGPSGSLHEFTYSTRKHHGSMTFMPGTIQSTRSTTKPVAHGQLGGQHYYGSGSSLGAHYEFIAVDTEIEPVWGMTAKYTPVGVTIHTDQMVDTNGNNVTFEGSHPSRFRIARSGHYRLTVNVLMKDNTGADKKNLFMFRRSGSNTANGYRVGTTSDLIGLARWAGSHVEEAAVIFNNICELNQGDEVYPCVQMNSSVGYDKIFIDMTTYFNIEEI